MLLLTGATGLVGSALLRRLLGEGRKVRCLVRDPRRLGPERVRVQIALGDLTDPPSFRNALRGVQTVIHLAAAIRDQPRGSIEELNGIATWRMVEAAERRGVERFVYFSALGAATHHRTRCLRAKALAEQAVREAQLDSIVFAPSLVYAPHDPWLTLLERLALLPLMPVSGSGRAEFQPIWAEDVASCVVAALRADGAGGHVRYEIAGPETLSTHRDRAHRDALAGPQPPARARPHAARLALAAPAGGGDGAARLRDVGRGRADGGVDGERSGRDGRGTLWREPGAHGRGARGGLRAGRAKRLPHSASPGLYLTIVNARRLAAERLPAAFDATAVSV